MILGANFVSTNKKILFMDITAATESTILDLEKQKKGIYAESLCQKISDVFETTKKCFKIIE